MPGTLQRNGPPPVSSPSAQGRAGLTCTDEISKSFSTDNAIPRSARARPYIASSSSYGFTVIAARRVRLLREAVSLSRRPTIFLLYSHTRPSGTSVHSDRGVGEPARWGRLGVFGDYFYYICPQNSAGVSASGSPLTGDWNHSFTLFSRLWETRGVSSSFSSVHGASREYSWTLTLDIANSRYSRYSPIFTFSSHSFAVAGES